jgi:hypothetical protein
MDRVGVRELLRLAVDVCARRYRTAIDTLPTTDVVPRDAEVELVLDRLAQTGITLLRHKVADIWEDLLSALLEIFNLGVPENHASGSLTVPPRNADFLLAVMERVFLLGGYANQLKRYDFARHIVTQVPVQQLRHYYWIRFAVTMSARGELESFKGKKSLIPLASEYVRTRPEFFQLFKTNMDVVVDNMCQFDFFNCVLSVHLADDVRRCYPNFGLYWNHRTTPIVIELVTGGEAREALADVDDRRLAQILTELDEVTAQSFFDYSGWDRGNWGDRRIAAFLEQHLEREGSDHAGTTD